MSGKTKRITTKTIHLSNPYSSFKKVFSDFAYSKIMIFYTIATLAFHMLSLFLQIYYVATNYSVELICRYGPMMCLAIYVVTAKVVGVFYYKTFTMLENQCLFVLWKTCNSSPTTQRLILNKSLKMNQKLHLALMSYFLLAIVMLPTWGDLNELFIFSQVYERYFKFWAPVLYYFYISTFLWCSYYSFHLPGCILYLTLLLDVQIKLINDKITEIDQNFSQNEISETLRLCISHHIALKRWMSTLAKMVNSVMPVFVLLGALSTVAVSFFVLNTLQNTTMILKIRLAILTVCNFVIVSTFAELGQIFSDQNNSLFEHLIDCPWYLWNVKNRKILLMFMANCMKPKTFSWGGITLDYSFAISILKTSFSYALILFKLRGETIRN
ncbi:odorant receptor 160 [Tribolium castaneum]|uniref:Odorant receptor n=1 Tax=Tribolium castaneum TaxID=7070 RepID=D2A271_TRICA|nr:odorant receptor 160 [Tribolium castaneum]